MAAKQVTVKLAEKLYERIKKYASEESVTPQTWINNFLKDHLDLLDQYASPLPEGRKKKDSRSDRR